MHGKPLQPPKVGSTDEHGAGILHVRLRCRAILMSPLCAGGDAMGEGVELDAHLLAETVREAGATAACDMAVGNS